MRHGWGSVILSGGQGRRMGGTKEDWTLRESLSAGISRSSFRPWKSHVTCRGSAMGAGGTGKADWK